MCKWEERENEEKKMIVRDMIVNRVGESGDFSSLKDFMIGSCCSRLRELVAPKYSFKCKVGRHKKRKGPSGRSGGTLYGGGDDLLSHSLLQYHRRDGA